MPKSADTTAKLLRKLCRSLSDLRAMAPAPEMAKYRDQAMSGLKGAILDALAGDQRRDLFRDRTTSPALLTTGDPDLVAQVNSIFPHPVELSSAEWRRVFDTAPDGLIKPLIVSNTLSRKGLSIIAFGRAAAGKTDALAVFEETRELHFGLDHDILFKRHRSLMLTPRIAGHVARHLTYEVGRRAGSYRELAQNLIGDRDYTGMIALHCAGLPFKKIRPYMKPSRLFDHLTTNHGAMQFRALCPDLETFLKDPKPALDWVTKHA